jgi:hypothetical protein
MPTASSSSEVRGDSAYTGFHAADVVEHLGALGSCGYRAAQLEAVVAAGRLALAAFMLGYGVTGPHLLGGRRVAVRRDACGVHAREIGWRARLPQYP